MPTTATPKRLYMGNPTVDIATPSVAATLGQTANGSSTLQANTYYVKYTWINANGGETLAGPEASFTVSPGYQLNVSLPALPTGCTGAKIYISTVSGANKYQGQTATTSYSQTIAIDPNAASVPSVSTLKIVFTATAKTLIKNIRAVNTTGNPAVLNGVFVVPNTKTSDVYNQVLPSPTIAANDMINDDGLIVLEVGDTIRSLQTTDKAICLTISGVEVA
jgi:hypothetical protein